MNTMSSPTTSSTAPASDHQEETPISRVDSARGRSIAGSPEPPRSLLRLGAVAGVTGMIAQLVLELFLHPSGADPNDSVAAFTEYAASTSWIAVHLGQFAAFFLVAIALMTVATRLRAHGGLAAALAVVGALAVAVATAVFAVQMAVDGVALRHAVIAWNNAPPGAAQDGAFLVAETVRSIEKGLSAVFHFSNGAALLALGTGVAARRRPALLGWFGTAAGVGFIVASWITAHTGFSPQAGTILLPTSVLALVFVVGASASLRAGRRRPLKPWRAITGPASTIGKTISGRLTRRRTGSSSTRGTRRLVEGGPSPAGRGRQGGRAMMDDAFGHGERG